MIIYYIKIYMGSNSSQFNERKYGEWEDDSCNCENGKENCYYDDII